MPAKTIMVQGTASDVGKSIIAAALCRIFAEDGYSVAPFKAQNMALNSFVTKQGHEIGRAQAVQAEAARIEPTVDMNPILLKPTKDDAAQVVVHGKPIGNMTIEEYRCFKTTALERAMESFNRLSSEFDIVVIEGAGSPAEVNLKDDEIVNMNIARLTKSPVILAGDIDKGGVFASIVGTLSLLDEDERGFIKGLLINKFRGKKEVLEPGLRFLEAHTGLPVIGVVPFIENLNLPLEDSVNILSRASAVSADAKIDIAVVKLRHISNFSDIDSLCAEGDVNLRFVSGCDELKEPDLLILPGSKNTIDDLNELKRNGLYDAIIKLSKKGCAIFGLCGGYQMLGQVIKDPDHIESGAAEIRGLGLLDIHTVLAKEKKLSQAEGEAKEYGCRVFGYEMHHGETEIGKAARLFLFGAQDSSGRIMGTYLHGIFDSDEFRRKFLDAIRIGKGLKSYDGPKARYDREDGYRKLASVVRANLNMEKIYDVIFQPMFA